MLCNSQHSCRITYSVQVQLRSSHNLMHDCETDLIWLSANMAFGIFVHESISSVQQCNLPQREHPLLPEVWPRLPDTRRFPMCPGCDFSSRLPQCSMAWRSQYNITRMIKNKYHDKRKTDYRCQQKTDWTEKYLQEKNNTLWGSGKHEISVTQNQWLLHSGSLGIVAKLHTSKGACKQTRSLHPHATILVSTCHIHPKAGQL